MVQIQLASARPSSARPVPVIDNGIGDALVVEARPDGEIVAHQSRRSAAGRERRVVARRRRRAQGRYSS